MGDVTENGNDSPPLRESTIHEAIPEEGPEEEAETDSTQGDSGVVNEGFDEREDDNETVYGNGYLPNGMVRTHSGANRSESAYSDTFSEESDTTKGWKPEARGRMGRRASDLTEVYPEEVRNFMSLDPVKQQKQRRMSLQLQVDQLKSLQRRGSIQGSNLSLASGSDTEDKKSLDSTSLDHRRMSLGRRLSAYTAIRYQQSLTLQQAVMLQSFSSVNYRPTHSDFYLEWLKTFPHRMNWDRWFITLAIAIAIGLMGALLKQCLTALDRFKWDVSREFAQDDQLGLLWCTVAAISVVFILIASFSVTVIHPPAAGSGVPEVISFLNGVVVHGALQFKTLVVKFVALVFTVSSGLPCGLQGPLIAMGAVMGSGIGQFRSKCINFKPRVFERLRNPEDRRSFTTAGVAAGVAAGFNAPIGGLLFAMEDLSSFWNKRICWHTFFCSAIAALTASVFNTAFSGFKKQEDFGLLSLKVTKPLQLSILVFLPAAILGVVGGLLGAVFTRGNANMVATRKKLVARLGSPRLQSAVKMGEAVVLVLVMVTTATVLPAGFGCSVGNQTSEQIEEDEICGYSMPFSRVQYNCPGDDDHNQTGLVYYNELATLIQGSGTALLDKLWSRDTAEVFSYWPMLALFPIWFVVTMWTCGAAVAGGIFVPTLVSGSLYGRLIGLALMQWMEELGSLDTKEWLDPGTLAVIGAASLLGGVTRLNVAVTVIVVEMSRDLELTIPILVSIWVAKLVADFLSKPIYSYQLDAKALPYLPAEPLVILGEHVVNLEFYRARHVMSRPVFTLKSLENISALAKVLLETSHGGYPVCKYDPDSRKELTFGLITRSELYVLLTCDDLVAEISEGAVVLPKVTHEMMSEDIVKESDEGLDKLENYARGSVYKHVFLDLEPFISQSVYKVDENFSLSRTYEMFRLLGLRHILVTDLHNEVAGVITRKDLIAFSIQQSLATLDEADEDEDVTDMPPLSVKQNVHPSETQF